MKKCAICGKDFEPKSNRQIYCSKVCMAKGRKQKRDACGYTQRNRIRSSIKRKMRREGEKDNESTKTKINNLLAEIRM